MLNWAGLKYIDKQEVRVDDALVAAVQNNELVNLA
jgi:hypothetical protein